MAFKLLFSVLVVVFAVIQVDCYCRKKLVLSQFQIIDRDTGKVVTRLPLKTTKNLKVKVKIDVGETLNQDWFSAKISAKATALLAPFNFKITRDVPCTLKKGCEFREMSCSQFQRFLGLTHIGCPLRGPKAYQLSAPLPPIGDLTVHIPPSIRRFVKSITVKGRLDVWDNYGNQIACLTEMLEFYKDY